MKNIHTHHFFAMGSQINLWLELEEKAFANQLLQEAEAIFRTNERRMTRFNPHSELSQLNGRSGDWVYVSHTLWGAIDRSLEMAWATDGLFDPTQLDALEAAGYATTFECVGLNNTADLPPITQVELGITFRDIELDRPGHRLKLPLGLRLDLGGIGKGFTAQEVMFFLNQFGPCLIDAGGDLTAGAAPSFWSGWAVGIAAPWAGDASQRNLVRLWLSHASLATSGIDYRRWVSDGVEAHHIIDPRTGSPAETDLLTVSVLHTDACTAEAWATAALVAGSQNGYDLLLDRDLAAAAIHQNYQLSMTATMHPLAQIEPAQEPTSWMSPYESVQYS